MCEESLSKINPKKLLLLDFGSFNRRTVVRRQDFDRDFLRCLDQAKLDFKKYKKIVFLFDKHTSIRKAAKIILSVCTENISI